MRRWPARGGRPPSRRKKRALEFSLDVTARLIRYARTRRCEAHGTLSMDGVAKRVPVHGELLIDPIGRNIIRYELGFVGDDGKQRRFVGQRTSPSATSKAA